MNQNSGITCMFLCLHTIFFKGYGLSSIWRNSELEEPSTYFLSVGRLWHRPQWHSRATKPYLFWPMGERRFSFGLFRYCVFIRFFWTQTSFKSFPCQIADGQRELIRSHSVKNRHFIGNTSMDAGLSFIMANHAKVKKNDLVFDPFVGTGKKTGNYSCCRFQDVGLQNVVCLCFRKPAGRLL